MTPEPPEGSKIKVDRTTYSTSYVWDNGSKSIFQYPMAAFFLFWLGGWTVGGIMTITLFLSGEDMTLFVRLFLLFWLGGWACGEVAVTYILYCMLRPLKPAKLSLSGEYIEYETGTKPFGFKQQYYSRSKNPYETFKGLRNKTYNVEVSRISNLCLERVGERQRLTFDYGVNRVEIGETLSEPEREWLYEILKQHLGY